MYLKIIQKTQLTERRAILQKNNDSSHETKSTDNNLAKNFKQKHDIKFFKHLTQSSNLNSCEDV